MLFDMSHTLRAMEKKMAQHDIVWSLMREKIAVVLSAKLFNQRNLHPTVGFEFLQFEWVDDVSEITGNHEF